MKKYFKHIFALIVVHTILLTFSEFVVAEISMESDDNTSLKAESSAQTLTKSQLTIGVSEIATAETQKEANITQPSLSEIDTQSSIEQQSPSIAEPTFEALQKQLEHLKLQHDILTTENAIQTEKYQKNFLKLQLEKNKLQLNRELQSEKNNEELTQLRAEKEKLLLENELQIAQQSQILAKLETLKARLVLENEIDEQEKTKMFASLEKERQQLAMQNLLAEEINKKEELKIQFETAKLTFKMAQLESEKAKYGFKLEELAQKISEREHREIWENRVNKPNKYLKDPFVDGHLIISDRKIEMDTVIVPGTADYINERIHYYNNKSTEYPIFLVINVCFGGSVMEGTKIIEIMRSSNAPVYVVVKTLAASMAATITTLAKHSYAYPNALIVHHQVLNIVMGNQKQIKEGLEIVDEWTRRIMHPVAEKMGITMTEFVKKMYERNSTGDWHEFSDIALKLKWVNNIVTDIRDTSFTKNPADTEEELKTVNTPKTTFSEKMDSQGQRYVELPHLNPLDVYYLYDPADYYR
jgi:ATP-dependent Clp protease protease subunit